MMFESLVLFFAQLTVLVFIVTCINYNSKVTGDFFDKLLTFPMIRSFGISLR